MPYGASVDNYTSVNLFGYNHHPSGSDFYDRSEERIMEPIFYRYGGNSNTFRSVSSTKPPPVFEYVPVVLRRGPRLPYKFYDRRYARFRWAREPITVYKLRKVRRKSRAIRYAKGLNLVPNALQFATSVMKVMPHSSKNLLGVYQLDDSYKREYVGNLWNLHSPVGGSSAFAFNPAHSTFPEGGTLGLIGEASDRALRKLYASVNNSETNLLNALAERAQTISMLSDLVKRLGAAILHAKRGNLYAAAKDLFPWGSKTPSKDIANDFLMFQYGIKPLISDIDGLITHLNKWEPLVFDVKASSTEKLEPAVYESSISDAIACTERKSVSGKAQVTWKVRVKTKDTFSRNLSRLGLTNLTATAWELIPWSHIIDWLLSVGAYLDTRDAFENLEILFCTKTIFLKEDTLYDRTFGGIDSSGYVWEEAKTQVIVSKVYVTRELLAAPPDLPLPTVKNPVSLQHIANALAHLRQLSRR